ncbi:hypothetical protein LF63_0109030 [Oleiagrimonas soli]|uniref:Uncharacterized protein n=1 Tax=Oleiagrimonas soli TaxID=1543381 RepID=A0A099CV46_9GAMM|nr:hypothetical protein LF63_0109030 [Oleiagrimonas soli]
MAMARHWMASLHSFARRYQSPLNSEIYADKESFSRLHAISIFAAFLDSEAFAHLYLVGIASLHATRPCMAVGSSIGLPDAFHLEGITFF